MNCEVCGSTGTEYGLEGEAKLRILWVLGDVLICACCYKDSFDEWPVGHGRTEEMFTLLRLLADRKLLLVEFLADARPEVRGNGS